MTFIGVWFDTEELTLSATPERVQEILDVVHTWLRKHSTIFGGKTVFRIFMCSREQGFHSQNFELVEANSR